jgi:hypothetical protein
VATTASTSKPPATGGPPVLHRSEDRGGSAAATVAAVPEAEISFRGDGMAFDFPSSTLSGTADGGGRQEFLPLASAPRHILLYYIKI